MSQRDRKTCPEDAKACSDVQTEVLKNTQTWKRKMRKSPKMWKEVKEEENMEKKRRLEGQPGRAVIGTQKQSTQRAITQDRSFLLHGI